MNWDKAVNAAAYFLWALVLQVAVAIAALKRLPETANEWVLLLAGALLAANGKLSSSSRLSPVGYEREPWTSAQRATKGLPSLSDPTYRPVARPRR